MTHLDLSEAEVRLLVQSLDHCLATCRNQGQPNATPCTDCDAAKALRDKLASQVGA